MTGDNGFNKKTVTKTVPLTKTVPFYKLFAFADCLDKILMIAGSIGAIGNGLCQPLKTVLFGEMVDSFGQNQSTDVVSVVSKVALKYVYLAIGCGAAAFLQVACWMITGERQAARIRSLYLRTILRQDVAFFDNETSTGEVVGRMSGDTVLIQDAMGEKVGKFIQVVSEFLAGLVIAFVKGWLLTLVVLSSIPLLVITGGIISRVLSKMASRGQDAYAKAAIVVEQTIGSIRMVASFTGEKQVVADQFLMKAYQSGVHEAWASGLGLGSVTFITFCTHGLAFWFGAKMIIEKGYTGGQVLNIIFAVLNSST